MSLLGGLFGQKKSEGAAQGKAASTAPDLKAIKESINRMENVLVRLQKAPLADVKNIERDILAYQRELASYMAALPTNHKAWVYLKGASGLGHGDGGMNALDQPFRGPIKIFRDHQLTNDGMIPGGAILIVILFEGPDLL